MVLVAVRRDAKWELRRVFRIPLYLGDFLFFILGINVEPIISEHWLFCKPHCLTMRGIGVSRLTGPRAEHFFEHKHIPFLQVRVMPVEGGLGSAFRKATAFFQPGVKLHVFVRSEQRGYVMHRLEDDRLLRQRQIGSATV